MRVEKYKFIFLSEHTQTENSLWKRPKATQGHTTVDIRRDGSPYISTVYISQENQTRYRRRAGVVDVVDMGRPNRHA